MLANIKTKVLVATEEYINTHCDNKGNILNSNVDKAQLSALKSLKTKVNNGEIIVMTTDKSGKLACESRDQYIASMQPHIANDQVISLEEKNNIENNINGHCIQFGRILKIGQNQGHWNRIKSALVNKFGHVPVLYGLKKDHKTVAAGQPTPTRPVCGANDAPNAQLCHLLSTIVTAVANTMDEDLKTVARSTEEVITTIEEVNAMDIPVEIVIISTDAELMFPSLEIEIVARVAAEEFMNSKLDIDMDWQELALYLAVTHTQQQLDQLGLSHVTHTRVHRTGPRPEITTEEIVNRNSDTVSKFRLPARVPTEDEQRKMFAVALENLIKTAMGNHVYSFNGLLRRQSSGAAIGTTLAGALAVLYMLRWCREFKVKLEFATTEIENFILLMIKVYIDDGNLIAVAFPPGARICSDGKIRVIEQYVAADRDIPADQRTARLIGQIANTVSSFIKLTTDYPSKHPSGYMPLLDIQAKVNERNQVEYKFYSKPMSSQFVILANSAMPTKIKRNCLVQEAIRRLRNTKRELNWSLKAEILSEFCNKMMISGYSEKFRFEVIQAAVRGYEKQLDDADRGIKPLYRNREFQAESRWKKKSMTKTTWYRPDHAVGFIPATPNGTLSKKIQDIVTEETARIKLSAKIVEKGGVSLKQQLVRVDLTGCFYPDCYLCESGTKGGSHTRSGVHYSGICTLCEEAGVKSKYDGESGRSGYWRSKFHKEDIKKNNPNNAFSKHLNEFHGDHIKEHKVFKLKVESTHTKCLERQIKEGVAIKNSNADHVMNSKAEYHQPAVRRVTTTREVGS